jgi:hypothetical protein
MAEPEIHWRARDQILWVIAGSLGSRHVDPEPIVKALQEHSIDVRIAAIRDWTSELLLPFVLDGVPPPTDVIETVVASVLAVPDAKDISSRANDIATGRLLERAGVSGITVALEPIVSPELADWPTFSEWAAMAHHLAIPNPPVPEDFLSEAVREALDNGIVLAMLENDRLRATQLLRWGALMPPSDRPWYSNLADHLAVFGCVDAHISLNHAIWLRLQVTN